MKRKCHDGDVTFNAEDGICQVNVDIFAFTFDWCDSSLRSTLFDCDKFTQLIGGQTNKKKLRKEN